MFQPTLSTPAPKALLFRAVVFGTALLCTAVVAQAQSTDVTRDPFTPTTMQERIKLADEERVERIAQEAIKKEVRGIELRILENAKIIAETSRDDMAAENTDFKAELYERIAEIEEQVESGVIVGGSGDAVLDPEAENPLADMLGMGGITSDEDAKGFIDSLTFVACVGTETGPRALYRDTDGSTFFSEVMDALDKNSRCNG